MKTLQCQTILNRFVSPKFSHFRVEFEHAQNEFRTISDIRKMRVYFSAHNGFPSQINKSISEYCLKSKIDFDISICEKEMRLTFQDEK